MRITAGTTIWRIPLTKGYELSRGYPLVIRENKKVIIECPPFEDYGQGDTFGEALHDLGSSIVDFWESLKRKESQKLSDGLKSILKELDFSIKKKRD